MKKLVVLGVVIAFVFVLVGCQVINLENELPIDILQKMNIVYENGDYSISGATCTGYVTSGQTELCLAIPISKTLQENQNITVTSLDNAAIRENGRYVIGLESDLTQYYYTTGVRNDGTVLLVRLRCEDKWRDDNGEIIPNNTVVAGQINISFTVS